MQGQVAVWLGAARDTGVINMIADDVQRGDVKSQWIGSMTRLG